jgi:hypothetical protein
LLRLNPPDALAAGPAGSVLDAGTLGVYRFEATDHGADLYDEGLPIFDGSLQGLLPGDQHLADGGIAVLANGTVVLDGNAYGAPGDCHHAVLMAITTNGQRRLLGDWQPHVTGPSC